MAKQTKTPRDEPGDEGEGENGAEPQTSGRLYTVDLLELRQVAGLLQISTAEAYRRFAAPVVNKVLKAEARRVADS